MNQTSIEWTDATWNPVRGCSRVSEGCRNASRSPNVERPLFTEIVGPPHEDALKGRYVAAICPRCGGWTMMHGDPLGSAGKEWMMREYAHDQLIVYWRNPVSLGLACPQSERRNSERTCGDG